MESINEVMSFLKQSVETYTGGNRIWLLYPVALVLIWILGKKEDRKLFVGAFVVECLTIFNPLLVKILVEKIGFGNRYCRLMWLLVFFVTIGYALTLLIFRFKKIWMRMVALILAVALVVVFGNPVFTGKDASPYTMAENSWFIGNDILNLSAIIHSEGIEQPKILGDGVLLAYRQYDPSVTSYLERGVMRRTDLSPKKRFMRSKKFDDQLKKIVAVYFYHDYELDASEFQKLVKDADVDYIISSTEDLNNYLNNTSMTVIGQTGIYSVWKVL